ncbi:Mitochondrial Processing Peptidase alpha subunit [Ectocarpus siliculosus]|uniref:Mitochondrial Processing Peptidase alpha subunit n=1 Tax=Ectocarpus siliculosus TaxID=2880 RepID=D7FU77_ECTSI|nr:Mitochondrial Processing Peptidase alpha subunit [Ectocarpus siliculosus]|eukprot:CBJ31604.1 Mitochondrial Processing Peptidase alpha subunit [Ectocarpus siliculosus]
MNSVLARGGKSVLAPAARGQQHRGNGSVARAAGALRTAVAGGRRAASPTLQAAGYHRAGQQLARSSGGAAVGGRELHNSASKVKEPEEVVVLSSSRTAKSVDKSAMLEARKGRFPMDRPFPGVPPLKPPGALKRPETLTTTLPNGLRVASQETYGALCTFGIVVNAGSRLETDLNTGTCHLLELMAFKSTATRSHQQVVSEFEEMGGTTSTHGSRDQMLYCVDVLRDNLERAVELLADTLINPRVTPEEVEEQKAVIGFQLEDTMPEVTMRESLMTAAFKGQPLGRPYWCPKSALPKLEANMVRSFRKRHFTPGKMVLAGAGVDHDELVRLGNKYFGGLEAVEGGNGDVVDAAGPAESSYVGGESRNVVAKHKDKLTRVSVAFKVGGWHDDLLVPTCVLQVLLGGGDSFSAGGPGKGMYSRLYREVLNRFYWAEAAEAFSMIHDETGLLGIAGAAADKLRAGQLMHVFCEHFATLATVPVTDEELSRARNMLKCNVLTHLESRLVLFEDIGRQMLTYGRRETPESLVR